MITCPSCLGHTHLVLGVLADALEKKGPKTGRPYKSEK